MSPFFTTALIIVYATVGMAVSYLFTTRSKLATKQRTAEDSAAVGLAFFILAAVFPLVLLVVGLWALGKYLEEHS